MGSHDVAIHEQGLAVLVTDQLDLARYPRIGTILIIEPVKLCCQQGHAFNVTQGVFVPCGGTELIAVPHREFCEWCNVGHTIALQIQHSVEVDGGDLIDLIAIWQGNFRGLIKRNAVKAAFLAIQCIITIKRIKQSGAFPTAGFGADGSLREHHGASRQGRDAVYATMIRCKLIDRDVVDLIEPETSDEIHRSGQGVKIEKEFLGCACGHSKIYYPEIFTVVGDSENVAIADVGCARDHTGHTRCALYPKTWASSALAVHYLQRAAHVALSFTHIVECVGCVLRHNKSH